MRSGVDIGVHAKRHARPCASRLRRAIDALELAGRFRVDRFQLKRHCAVDFIRRLANAGEDDVGRLESGAQGKLDFADRVGVDGAADVREHSHDGQRRVRLERVVNAVRVAVERLVQGAIGAANRFGAVHVERRAVLARDRVQPHAVADQRRTVPEKTQHGRMILLQV